MRKFLYITLAFLSVNLSCTKEVDKQDESQAIGQGHTVFVAQSEFGGTTKTILRENGQIDWLPGDKIHVFKGLSDCGVFTTDISEQSASAEFMGYLSYSESDKDAFFWATYPYSTDNTCDGNSVTVVIPDLQVATEDSFDKNAFATIAVSKTTQLLFYNVCGGVKISVTETGIKRIVFRGNNDEILAGCAKVILDQNGKPVVESVSSPKSVLTLEAPDGKELEVGKWYYIAALPAELSNGFSVLFQKEHEYTTEDATLFYDKSVRIKRGVWGRLDNADNNEEYTLFGKRNVIAYRTTDNQALDINSDILAENIYDNDNNIGYLIFWDDLNYIPNSLFEYQGTLSEVFLPDSITSIGSFVFYGCNSLACITLPSSLQTIGVGAFGFCKSLTSIVLPYNIASIAASAFVNCTSLTSIIIPKGLTSLEYAVFKDCTSLTRVSLPEGITSIGGSAFSGCKSLTSITLPEGITSIGSSAFRSCSSLTNLILSPGLTSIEREAFRGCFSLTNITLPEGLTSIENSAFYGCTSLMSITLPEGLTNIGEMAFGGCTSLTNLTIPGSIMTVGNRIFIDCSSLVSFSSPLASEDGRCLIIDGSIVAFAPANISEYCIPNGVTSIGYSAFSYCESLTSISLPKGLTIIGNDSFSGCTSLMSITLPEGITSIGNESFSGCTSLMSITLPEGIMSIGNYAFYRCTSLINVKIPGSVIAVGVGIFSGCSSLVSITSPLASEDGRCLIIDGSIVAFAPANITEYVISDGVTSINGAFYGCRSLTSITLPEGITSIGNYSFQYCTSLIDFFLPEGITSIGRHAFSSCKSLVNMILPSSLTSIGDAAFTRCSSLASITIKAVTPPTIGQSVFDETNNCPIFVPKKSLDAYKTASVWCDYYATRIKAIEE